MTDTLALSREIRLQSLKMVFRGKASHIGGALSVADILAVLYGRVMQVDPRDPEWSHRDRFFLSKGHACTALYAVLSIQGFFPKEMLEHYVSDGSPLQGHASHHLPGVELSTGSLGHALPVACGVALAAKRKKLNFRIFVVLSDGELNEGSNWEALMFAAHHRLDNLTVLVDYNKIQSLGRVEQVLDPEPLAAKCSAFRWEVREVNGHCHQSLTDALLRLASPGVPFIVLAHTKKGKGVDFMEDQLLWHYKSPDEKEYMNAVRQLEG